MIPKVRSATPLGRAVIGLTAVSAVVAVLLAASPLTGA